MNWVGGARRRIKGFSRNDRKIQKEYFERKRLSAEALKAENHDSKVKVKNRPTSSKQGSKVSQDLLAFQIARKTSQNRGNKEQANFRVLDLGKKKTVPGNAIIAGKCIQTVDLPISPQEAPSVLNLSGSPVNSKSSDTNTSGYNTQQWYKQRNHCGDAKRKEVTPKKKHLVMDFLGEKLPVPMSHPPRERTQHQREHLFCPKPQQSAESGYQTDITSRYVSSQVPSLSHYDADSDVSSLVSSFPHKQRFTRKSGFLSADSPQVPAKWWTQNGTRQEVNAIHTSGLSGQSDQNLLPDPETRTEYLHKAQSVQRRSRRDSVVQELFMHQEIHSPLMNFSLDKITNHQPHNFLEDAETSSGSFFTGALPHYHDNNVHQKFIHGKLPVPSFFSTQNNHTRQALREQSPPCSNSSPNAIISLQNHSVNDSISGMFYTDRSIHSRNKPHASDVLNHKTNNSNRMNKAVYRDSEPNICVTKQSDNSKMKDSDSERRDSHGDLYQNCETRCDSPVVPAENNREMYKQAAAMTPSTPVNYRRSYDDCLNKQSSRKPQPPDTASTSTFCVSRRHSASSASNVYLEICSLEDQVPLQKEKTSAAGNRIKINTANEKTPTRKNSLDSDILTLVNQMVDYIVMDQNLSSALERTVKKNGGHLPALHLHSTLGLLSEDRVQLCGSSSKSPLNSPVKSLLDPVLGEAAQVERKPTNNVQSACETDRRPVLVDAACSPLRVVCPQFQAQTQRRYNTRRHGSSLNFCARPSPRPPVNQRKHRKMSTNSREMKKEKQAIKENETEQMHLTQPED